MLKLSGLEFFLRAVPEGFIFIFAIYAFSNTKLQAKKFVFSGFIMAVVSYSIRFLPIDFGVHSLMSLIALIGIAVRISDIDIKEAIKGSIGAMLLGFICEIINIFIIEMIFKKDIDKIFKDPFLKIIYGLPSISILGCVVFICYKISMKRVKKCLI
jgi:hypothetical protein